jgi:hypothetical protein
MNAFEAAQSWCSESGTQATKRPNITRSRDKTDTVAWADLQDLAFQLAVEVLLVLQVVARIQLSHKGHVPLCSWADFS